MYPIRVQRAPEEGRVYLHFGSAERPPMQTRSFPLLDDDHLEAGDFLEGIELAKLLGTWCTTMRGEQRVMVGLPGPEED